MKQPTLLVAALACVGAMVLGCSDTPAGSGDGDGNESESPTVSASATDDVIVPDGIELTEEGSALSVGDTATVAYEPRQGVVAVLDIRVTRLEKTTFKESFAGWDLDADDKKANPYFVRATVTNRGTTDLGGRPVPLYIVDGTDHLVEASSFLSTFKPCSPGVFPKKFGEGKALDACLVYLAPKKGDLVAVSFRPTDDYNPITWTGEIQKPRPPKGDKNKGDKDKGKGDQGN